MMMILKICIAATINIRHIQLHNRLSCLVAGSHSVY